MVDTRAVGRLIATLRQTKGLTQQQLAAALNVSHQAVSKWENGAALPDIQTLLDLTKLFGITVEQLLNGTVPEARLEREEPAAGSTIGSFVGGVIDDIGNIFKSEPKETIPEDDGAMDAKVEGTPESAAREKVDLKSLARMAPFMSKGAVEEMLNAQGALTCAELMQFAPYIGGACLERLIRLNASEMDWDQLRQFAPYLKKETVDSFARSIARGERIAPPSDNARTPDTPSLEDVSRAIGQGVDTVVRKVVRIGETVVDGVSKTIDSLTTDAASREERLQRLRRSAFERAMDDGRWEWIEAHLSEVNDEELKKRISERANALGMQDWVCKNLGGYADAGTIETAIANGDWGWLGEHVWKFDDHLQQRVALAAMKAENWQWLSTYAEQIDMKNCVVEIANTARRAGARVLAAQLTRYDMDDAQIEKAALDATDTEDYEYLDLVAKDLKQDVLLKCCIRLAKQGKWEGVKRFEGVLKPQSLEWLMQLAIDAGDFDAVDMLDSMIKADEKKDGEA